MLQRTATYLNHIGIPLVLLVIFYLLDPFSLGFLAGYLLTVAVFIKRDFIINNLDFDLILVSIFSITYAIFASFNPNIYTQTVLFYGFFPPVFFLLGKYLVTRSKNTSELYYSLIGIAIIYSFSALLSVTINLLEGGFVQYDRSIALFWGGQTKTATLMAAYFTFNMCIPALLIAGRNRMNVLMKGFLIAVFVISLLCVFRLGSRTQVVIFLATALITLLFVIPRQSINRNVKLLFILLLSLGLVYLYVPIDLDSEYLSVLGERLKSDNTLSTQSAGGRSEKWLKSIQYLFREPLGWRVEEFGHSHNLWLDVARIGGLLPFFVLILFSIRTLSNTWKAIRLNKGELWLNVVLLSFTLAANMLFFVEPITEGIFSIFLVYCLFQGAISKYLDILRRKAYENSHR